jgi:pilus assembly protein CpaB
MAKRRLMAAFLVALAISGGCTFLLNRQMSRHGQKPVAKQKYIAAAVPLEAGQVLKAENLKAVDWPVSMAIQGGFLQPQTLIGRAVLYPLAANEPILERDLAVPGMGLTVKIPEGMRALALKSDEVVGVAGFLFPGSHVDVLVTYRSEKSPEPMTATVLQDSEVLAIGQQVQPDPTGKAATVNVVTLLMKPDDAERVVLASTQGSIHFVLRNSTDRGHVVDPPVELSELIPGMDVKVGEQREVKAPQIRRFIVETVLGDKRMGTSF